MIYSVDNPRATLQTPANKGNEAMAYLTYIIDYYDRLPPISIFLHAHRDGYPRAWHTDAESYSNVVSVSRLRLESVQARGFVNLRCSVVPGCPAEIQLSEATGKHQAFATAWTELFGDAKIPSKIGSPCCAQFAVSDIAILRNSKEDYVKYRKWLLDTHLDSNTSGWVFEYLWHIIFGREPVM